VAAAICLFERYAQRDDADTRLLADWILCHKGNRDLPFGSMTFARSLDGWYAEQEQIKKRYETRLRRQQREQVAKARPCNDSNGSK
jgi:hypothetical protein